jgi:hypothetical protein
MCVVKTPKMPEPTQPPQMQEAKQPDTMSARRQRRPNGMGGGTILTGPSGIATSGLNLGGATVLGG